jgi:hypothetical protein
MAFDFWVTQENVRRYRKMLEGQCDPKIRAMLEGLLAVEETKLIPAETSRDEVRRKIQRYRDKADELRAVADRTEGDDVRAQFRTAAQNYDALARRLEEIPSGEQSSAGKTG